MDDAVSTLRSGIDDLVVGTTKKLLILTPYDMASSRLLQSTGPEILGTAYSLALRDALSGLYTPGIDTWVVDMVTAVEDPQVAFLFKTGAEPCLTPNSATACNDYVFVDFVHLKRQ